MCKHASDIMLSIVFALMVTAQTENAKKAVSILLNLQGCKCEHIIDMDDLSRFPSKISIRCSKHPKGKETVDYILDMKSGWAIEAPH